MGSTKEHVPYCASNYVDLKSNLVLMSAAQNISLWERLGNMAGIEGTVSCVASSNHRLVGVCKIVQLILHLSLL